MNEYYFIGPSWEMSLGINFFWDRSLACCRKAIKAAYDGYYGENKPYIMGLKHDLEELIQESHECVTRIEKWKKLVSYIEEMEKKHHGQTITNT